MKILAIRGENLASLTHPFHIDFTQGRLGDSGLFAITGNTGAGKSTLLDAICLALYDQIARFPANKKNQAEIGHPDEADRLKANDVRSILSRGAVSGFAEVDFVGRDGEQYTARWTVRRARNRPDGKFQKQERSLVKLTDHQIFSGGQRDVQALIDEKIGLSWEQFRRAVILPQGDFAAFLKASVDERSALLERMTGTEYYSRLSVAAFERSKTEKQKLQNLLDKTDDHPHYTLDDRENLQIQIRNISTSQKQLTQQINLLREWHQLQGRIGELNTAVATSQATVKETTDAWHQQEHSRQRLVLLDKVQSVRTEHEQLDRIQIEIQNITSKHQKVVAELEQHKTEEQPLTQQLQALKLLLNQDEHQFAEIQREIRRARELDQSLTEKAQVLENARQQYVALQQETAKQELAYRDNKSQYDQVIFHHQELQTWLEQNRFWQKQAQQQQPLLKVMRDFLSEQVSWTKEQALLTQTQQQLREYLLVLQQQEDQFVQLQTAQNAITERLQLEGDEQNWQELQKLNQRWQDARSLSDRCYQMRSIAEQSVQLIRHLDAVLLKQQQLQQSLDAIHERNTQIAPEISELKTEYDTVKTTLKQAHLRSQLHDYRVYLVDDEPCPLCGSLHHPASEVSAENEAVLLGQLERQKLFLQQQIEQKQLEAVRLIESDMQLQRSQKELDRQKQQIENSLTTFLEQWGNCRQGFEQYLPEWPENTAGWLPISIGLAELHHQTNVDAGALQSEFEAARSSFERQQQLRQQLELLTTQLRQKERELTEIKYQHSEVEMKKNALELQQQDRLQRLRSLEQTLDEQLTPLDWQQYLTPQYGESWIQEWLQAGNNYLATETRFRDIEEQRQKITTVVDAIKNQLQVLREQLQLREQDWQTQHQTYEQLRNERAALLNGLTADQVETAWKTRIQKHQTQIDAQQAAIQSWQEKRIALQSQVESQNHYLQQLISQQRALLRTTMQQQQRLEMSEYDIRQLLLVPVEQVRLLREQLSHLDELLSQEKTRLHEREQLLEQQVKRCEDLVSSQPQWQGLATEDLVAKYAESQLHLQDIDQLLFELRRLALDIEQIKEHQEKLHMQIEAQQVLTDQWQQLSELIGSASGAKFRTFAQSLTLEQLLQLANAHLEELAPRYQLQRVPGTDLALQVIDRDMGDDIRAVESLSGGESFLVSLALALGLSSLSANDTRIESLFIDEGFGTLDPESLDTAIASLDALQAAGRQVGIISHVQTLVERIGVQIKVQSLGGGESRVILP